MLLSHTLTRSTKDKFELAFAKMAPDVLLVKVGLGKKENWKQLIFGPGETDRLRFCPCDREQEKLFLFWPAKYQATK